MSSARNRVRCVCVRPRVQCAPGHKRRAKAMGTELRKRRRYWPGASKQRSLPTHPHPAPAKGACGVPMHRGADFRSAVVRTRSEGVGRQGGTCPAYPKECAL